jgi:HAD superfamily hydrolase (TIGR01450 family)
VGGRAVPGGGEAVALLRGHGVRVLFATNNSVPTRAELREHLAGCGIPVDDADLLRSADVAATMIEPGSTAVVLGEAGLLEAVAERGVHVVSEGPADAVVVGLTRSFTYERVARAAQAVRGGARLIATNEDPTFPTPDGLVPGAGAVLAAVATAAEAKAVVAGKPHPPTAQAILARVPGDELRVMVGDRPSTDGALAAQLDVPFALVLSGVTSPEDAGGDTGAAVTSADLRALVATV